MSDTLIVDFRQQIFNDALFTLEQAKKLDPLKTPFEYWKFCTWSIVSSAICMESYIKSHIKSITDETGLTVSAVRFNLLETTRFESASKEFHVVSCDIDVDLR